MSEAMIDDVAETPAETVVEDAQVAEAPVEDAPVEVKTNEPPIDSPRWKEVYHQAKEGERKIAELEETMNAMVDHNKSLQEGLDSVSEKVILRTEMPDSLLVDPEGFARWTIDKAKAEMG